MTGPTSAGTMTAGQTPRERRKAKVRLEIARTAMDLFGRQGYEATTVADIARAADFGERTFYRYFATKEDVVFFDIGHLLDEVRVAIETVPPGAPMWPVIRAEVVASVRRFQEAGPEVATAALRSWVTDPALAGPFLRFCGRWQDVIARGWTAAHAADGGRGGDPADDLTAQLVAHYVISTCQACFRMHVHTGAELPPLLERAFDRLDVGLAGAG